MGAIRYTEFQTLLGHWSEGPARHRFERSPERRLSSER